MYFRNFLLIAATLAASTNYVGAERQITPIQGAITKDLGPKKVALFPRGGFRNEQASAVVSKAAKVVQQRAPSKSAAVVMGLLLAFNSGFVNGCALSGAVASDGSKQAVAAVTASWTNSALGVASGNMAQFKFLAKVILSFMSGSAIAGVLNPKPAPFQVTGSQFTKPFLVCALTLCAAGLQLDSKDTVRTGLYLCAMANGIQNSVTSTLTQNLCRTSHFTGISSDMGTFIGQILAGNKENLFKLKVFAGLAACFWLGGYTSFGVSKTYASSSLFFSAGLYVFLAAFYETIATKYLTE